MQANKTPWDSFARTDFVEMDPYIKEIIETGERIL
jgi:hypothetical protein